MVIKNKAKGWSGLSAECRECRNNRYREWYVIEDNRKNVIARATESTRKRRERPEVQEQNRIASREAKRRQLADPVERAKHQARWAMFNAKAHHCAPPWLTAEHERTIETIYAIAGFLTRRTGIKHEVDHYYPINNDLACGLHVPWNLRVIPQTANKAKANQLPS